MGTDIQCQQFIHFGAPQTIDDYVQIRRAGRDGSQSHAILLYSALQLRNVDSSMIRLLKIEKCFHELMLEPFKEKVDRTHRVNHFCCNNNLCHEVQLHDV